MRRRSERKKSTSPAPLPARRSRRSRKISENERTEDESTQVEKEKHEEGIAGPPIIEEINEEQQGEPPALSEEHAASATATKAASVSPVRKSRSTRTTPKKRNSTSNNQREKSSERKVETILEETENGNASEASANSKSVDTDRQLSDDKVPDDIQASAVKMEKVAEIATTVELEAESTPKVPEDEDVITEKGKDQQRDIPDDSDDAKNTGKETAKGSERNEEEVKVASLILTSSKDEEQLKTTTCDVLDIQTEDVERMEQPKEKSKSQTALKTDEQKENNHCDNPEKQEESKVNEDTSTGSVQKSVRKRKWLSKKVAERAPPVLAISTDSLKNIIADVVNPVPLSDVQLESSSEEEGLVTSDRETDERSLTPELRVTKEREDVNESDGEQQKPQLKSQHKIQSKQNEKETPIPSKSAVDPAPNAVAVPAPVARSPSPARNRASHVLFITNLVRPFTVLQLKGLLARTGKIVEEDGFWIDRIKSKCYVAYATEDEAIETRHALHGVRWPVSNPKCLNVDFGSRTDMDRAIQSTKNETPKYPQDNTRDNQHAGNTWSRLDASEKKPARPVREWDVGKKEPNEREKLSNDRRRSSKERVEARLRDSVRPKTGDEAERSGQDRKRSRERERGGRERERDRERSDHGRSRSGSPALKSRKKENEPPIRLLDDLFRKTKGTPCIYWLPLTPEAIAEKEAFRQKRIEEHKQRIKEREERLKEREREKRDTRRNRSNERRRSRSRDRERRRY